ncbi:hypothetical protein PUN28_008236 [Cardiocondyla obscurior]|uniref:Uncharacterized protein n=1 Tax=Cardiocondyla obscurior TaxID=286306 RepID=A0AAW2FZ91_9HYME
MSESMEVEDMEERGREREENVKLEKEEEKEKKKVGRSLKTDSWRRDRSNSLPIIRPFKKGEKRKEKQNEEKDRQVEKKKIGEAIGLEKRVRLLEIEKEKERKEMRKSNVIIKGMKIREEGQDALKGQVEELVKEMAMKVKVEEMRKIGGINKGG